MTIYEVQTKYHDPYCEHVPCFYRLHDGHSFPATLSFGYRSTAGEYRDLDGGRILELLSGGGHHGAYLGKDGGYEG